MSTKLQRVRAKVGATAIARAEFWRAMAGPAAPRMNRWRMKQQRVRERRALGSAAGRMGE